jgi:hypothetical protein
MDDEDSNNQSKKSGWTGSFISNGNTTFRFCRVDGRNFRPLSTVNSPTNHYALLKLGTTCPAGSTEFWRYFDNQDDRIGAPNINSASSSSGNSYEIDPNTWKGNTRLWFCLFKSGSSPMSQFPSFGTGFQYGVFAAPGFSRSHGSGWISTDDEDSNNKNCFSSDACGGRFGDAAGKAIITPTGSDGRNTTLNTQLVIPSTKPIARCTATPTHGDYRLESTLNGSGSTAYSGRTIVSYLWNLGNGGIYSGPGPFTSVFYNISGVVGTKEFVNTLTVTDSAGETSTATCSVWVNYR